MASEALWKKGRKEENENIISRSMCLCFRGS